MTVVVERCFAGNHTYLFRLTMRDGSRFTIHNHDGGYWTRASAIEAKNYIITHHGAKRSAIRFKHLS